MKKLLNNFLLYSLLAVFITASVHSENLFNGIVTAKACWFILLTGMMLVVFSVSIFLDSKQLNIKLNALDISVVLFLLTATLIDYLHRPKGIAIETSEYIGLLIIYFIIKNVVTETNAKLVLRFFIILTLSQLIIAILQFNSTIPSFNTNFKITGFFSNPGPFSIFISVLAAVNISIYLYSKQKIIKIITLSGVLAILLILYVTVSRAALLGLFFAAILIWEFKVGFMAVVFRKRKQQATFILLPLIIILMALALIPVYNLKKDSADGRVLIWKNSFAVAKYNLFTGTGSHNFPAALLRFQSKYFANHPERKSSEGSLAGNSLYAFNDFLQVLAEYGMVGVFFFILIFYNLAKALKVISDRKNQTFGNSSLDMLTFSSIGALVVIWVSGLVSYPLQVLALQILFFTSLALVSVFIDTLKDSYVEQSPTRKGLAIVICFTMGVYQIAGAKYIHNAFRALKTTEAENYSRVSLNALELYEAILADGVIYPLIKANEFLSNKQYFEAIKTLETAKIGCANLTLYYMLGDAYKMIKQYKKAEEQYKFACNAMPNLVKPQYLLAKFYYETHQLSKWNGQALVVINFKIKGTSMAAISMKNEIRNMYSVKMFPHE